MKKIIIILLFVSFGLMSCGDSITCMTCTDCCFGSMNSIEPELTYCEDGDLTFMGIIYPNLNELKLAINQFNSDYNCIEN